MIRHGLAMLDPAMRFMIVGVRRTLLVTASAIAMMALPEAPAWADDVPAATAVVTTIAPETPANSAAAGTATATDKPVTHHRHIHLETIDTTGLSAPMADGQLHLTTPLVMEARATSLRPAPLPDQDMDAPGPDAQTLAAQQEASLSPSVYGNKDHFSGDGFASGSNLESDKNNRRRPGGGMSLSIPVQ